MHIDPIELAWHDHEPATLEIVCDGTWDCEIGRLDDGRWYCLPPEPFWSTVWWTRDDAVAHAENVMTVKRVRSGPSAAGSHTT
ncbi:MAG: hypothetical protein ACRDXX_07080 [Stackebrandtia sp.]